MNEEEFEESFHIPALRAIKFTEEIRQRWLEVGGEEKNLYRATSRIGIGKPPENIASSIELDKCYLAAVNKIISTFQERGLQPSFKYAAGEIRVKVGAGDNILLFNLSDINNYWVQQIFPLKKSEKNIDLNRLTHLASETAISYAEQNVGDKGKLTFPNAAMPEELTEALIQAAINGEQEAPPPETNAPDKHDLEQVMISMNTILYGPPGTGKTYKTIDAALAILDPEFIKSQKSRAELNRRFDDLSKDNRIRFVTFHQSFSYEDFVEGLRAHSENGQLEYRVEAGVFKTLCDEARNKTEHDENGDSKKQPYVLIIDEINRGNISRIFGELITLIEPSKRAGAEEALAVTLPYSKELFTVPDNVYIIGTMNTADRSLAGLDLALRRRFTFTEMPPQPDLLKDIEIENHDDISINKMLKVMNQRITVLLDRDHCLGHAYFMPLVEKPTLAQLAHIFKQNILPLLQEYFFEDWERIRWVLNDQNKANAFIIKDSEINSSELFQGEGVQEKLRQAPQWKLNEEAFSKAEAYKGIIG